MAVSPDFLDYVLEHLEPLGGITHRRMFGGVGLSRRGLFFALIADDVLYFKADAESAPKFQAVGGEPFAPYGDGRVMGYWTVPIEALESPEEMAAWSGLALDAASRAKRPNR